MNGLPLRPLTPDADAPLMTPRPESYCELGFRLTLPGLNEAGLYLREVAIQENAVYRTTCC